MKHREGEDNTYKSNNKNFAYKKILDKNNDVYVNLKVPQNIIEISPRGNLKYPYDKS